VVRARVEGIAVMSGEVGCWFCWCWVIGILVWEFVFIMVLFECMIMCDMISPLLSV
jgi:hypothetical protein